MYVDDASVRSVLDFTRNSYCNTSIEFLTSINCCMLNGRVGNNNDFTCVSSKGQSVVDYCIVSYENVHLKWDSNEYIVGNATLPRTER